MAFLWTCPFCGRDTTINDDKTSQARFDFNQGNKHGGLALIPRAIVCPNPKCAEYQLSASIHRTTTTPGGTVRMEPLAFQTWSLVPQARMKVLPVYVPAPIVDDYKEACLIRELSPKASATLSRRCLQGMIRDFWKVSKPKLVHEIEAIRDKVDPVAWGAIDAVRKIGNIGAHMELDINVIVDVDSDEAELLIKLIETLVDDWYVERHNREECLQQIIALAAAKDAAKKQQPLEG